jgi:hypothetical protein
MAAPDRPVTTSFEHLICRHAAMKARRRPPSLRPVVKNKNALSAFEDTEMSQPAVSASTLKG